MTFSFISLFLRFGLISFVNVLENNTDEFFRFALMILISLQVGSEDISGVDFIVFEQTEVTTLSGHVEGTGLEVLQPHLSVEIKSSSDASKVESVLPLPLSRTTSKSVICPKASTLCLVSSGLFSRQILTDLNLRS